MPNAVRVGRQNAGFCDHCPMRATKPPLALSICLFVSLRRCVVPALALALAACSSVNPYYDPRIPHRGADGFHNNYPVAHEGSYWVWQWERWRDRLPPPPANGYRFPLAKPDTGFLRANRTEPSVTWIGHATVLLQIAGVNVLTDPQFSERASPVSFAGPRRKVAPGLSLDELPHIDGVVISHNHYDHLDIDSVRRLASQAGGSPRFYVPLGLKPWFAGLGIDDVVEMDWWESRAHGPLAIHCVPVQHWSKRTLTDRDQSLWSGWVLEHPSFRALFAGDTGYSPDFADIGRRFGRFDFAALPIGGYEPRWFMAPYHVNPEEALRIRDDVRADVALGIHWGTFELTDEALDEPPRALARARAAHGLAESRFFVLRHGETRRLGAGS
jgi:L-ascorbate metabolism protein UlaG (beta-lactamase superfamily)